MDLSRPIMQQCSAPSCRRRHALTPSSFYHVTMPNKHGGGTHLDAGFDCPACGHETVVPAGHLPKGLLGQLPSRKRWLEKRAVPTIPLPVWSNAGPARKALEAALNRALAAPHHVDAVMLVRRRDGGLSSTSADHLLNTPVLQLLDELDRLNAEILILGGPNHDGTRWRTVFDRSAGAATTLAAA